MRHNSRLSLTQSSPPDHYLEQIIISADPIAIILLITDYRNALVKLLADAFTRAAHTLTVSKFFNLDIFFLFRMTRLKCNSPHRKLWAEINRWF